jgi:hypothetical protein
MAAKPTKVNVEGSGMTPDDTPLACKLKSYGGVPLLEKLVTATV